MFKDSLYQTEHITHELCKIPVSDKTVKIGEMMQNGQKSCLVYGFDEYHAFAMEMMRNLQLSEPKNFEKHGKFETEDFFEPNENLELKNLNFPKKSSFSDLKNTQKQIFSGNVGIDFTNPIYQGSFNSLEYSDGSMVKFRSLLDSLCHLNPETMFLVFSFSKTDV